MKDTERVLKALANKRRLTILKYLQKAGTANVGAIAEEIKLSFKATSRHLVVLYAAELVEREQISLNMNYQLARPLHPITSKVLSIV